MDNLSVHKNEAVREQIDAAGCRLVYLPAYSPDFNPIECAFSILRKTKARTQEALEAAITAGLATINAADACAWFKHCQFPITQLP